MRIRSLASAILLFVSVIPAFAQQPATPSADDVARRAIDVLAGPAWDKARYIAFTFNVVSGGKITTSFPQRWDRFTGEYRVSGKDQKGDEFLVIMNTNTKQGRAWKNGAEVTEPSTLELGYRRFINDTYWLLMPLKSMDPGVHREYSGERTDSCGHTWDVVKLTWDASAGMTPGDIYWLWINRDTGVVEEWDTRSGTMAPEEAPVAIIFRDYQRVGGLLLSLRREVKGKDQIMRFDALKVLPAVPKGAFD